MRKKRKEFTREEIEKMYSSPPFSYSEWELEQHMKYYDESVEFRKTHPEILPIDMHRVNLTGYSDDTIDDVIRIHCDCGEEFTISGGNISLCSKCGKGYRVISYIAQYDKR